MNLHFKDGKFKIMQIADIQENVPLNPDTVKLIDLATEKEMPDLVVLTGDQIQGYSPCYRADAKNKVEACINSFLEPIVKRNIPFCFTYGNHDDDCKVDKKAQALMYRKHESCAVAEGSDTFDEGTYSLKIKDSNNEKDIFALYIIDSGKKEPDGSYSPVTKERIAWLRKQKKQNGYLPALLFQHIPVPEYYDVLKKCSRFTKGRVEAFKSRKNTFYILPEEGREEKEFLGENAGAPEKNSGEFAEIKKDGDIIAMWVGHDHNNSFRRSLDGVDLGYCQGAGFNTYGPGDRRGVRVFVLNETDLRNYDTYTVEMGELCDYRPSKPVKEFIYTHVPTSTNEALSLGKKVIASAVALGIGTAVIKHILK